DNYLKEAIDTWIDYGIDGIRVDAVKHMSLGWQKNWLSHIYENTGLFVFGEWYTGDTAAEEDMTSFANDSGMSLLDF
ncbi:alpha-amylase, partial [Enterococcus faecalis]